MFAGLYVLVERTRFGLAMRAVSEGPITADLLGDQRRARPRRELGALRGARAAAGILISSIYYLDPQFLTAFMITVFAAIVIGGLESIGGVLVGGLIFGVGQALLGYYVDARLSATVAFLSIAVMLLFFPNGLLGRRLHKVVEPVIRRSFAPGITLSADRLGERLTAGVLGAKRAVGIGVITFLFFVPWLFSSLTVFRFSLVAATFLAVLGQNVISGYGGQSSIGQSGFMVVGGYMTALLATNYHLSLLLVLVLSVLVSSAVGALLSFTAARLSGVYLALLTLTFALALPELAGLPAGTGGADGLFVPTQTLFGVELQGSTNLYLFCLITALLVTLVFQLAAQGSPGRRWRAVRDSEAGARSVGIRVERVKIAVVAIGGALAGLAATLTVLLIGYVFARVVHALDRDLPARRGRDRRIVIRSRFAPRRRLHHPRPRVHRVLPPAAADPLRARGDRDAHVRAAGAREPDPVAPSRPDRDVAWSLRTEGQGSERPCNSLRIARPAPPPLPCSRSARYAPATARCRCSTTSRSRWAPARPSPCLARTAPARRRCSASSPA